ncbi:SWIM zinc finger family protein [Corynebacterium pelargi]|uniref:Uncharacterized protein n=1 Tax=Corynebacterium pelargi TaxID=1471400 RepID=A0A410W9I6_9CORY|nr:SWIM zinc finger family protein [Corynebacterium pelargi]QAU52618.1 hypothetical protein CPELA_06780 [Corynebacterium pelargi]GGG77699.1 hypothetical protein GCM10007338_14480 [Corynebacterium pelargi]
MVRARKDNVIYANFGARSQQPAQEPLVQSHLAGAGGMLQQFILALADHGRIQRGQEYARQNKVMNLQLRDGQILAEVSGSQLEPFDVALILPYRSTDEIAQISQLLVQERGGIKRAREGDLSPQVLALLLAEHADDLRLRCSCPDPNYTCKHVIAVAIEAAQRLQKYPTEVFELRGLNIVALEQAVLSQAKQHSEQQSQGSSEAFWQGGELPDLPDPEPASALEDSDLQLLYKAMRLVSYSSVEELRAVADLEEMFDHLMGR